MSCLSSVITSAAPIVVGVSLVIYGYYVKVIKARNFLNEALSGIDVQLERRYEVLPNILTIAQKFMDHERGMITEITELRTKAMNAVSGSAEKFKTEGELSSKLSSLMVAVENYPQLKSNEVMVEAMKTYQDIEENIAAARRFYNTALRKLHDAVMIFPGSLFASFAGDYKNFAYFETEEGHKKSIKASDYLK